MSFSNRTIYRRRRPDRDLHVLGRRHLPVHFHLEPYTDSEGNVYEPVAMSRTAPTVNLKESSGSITVKMPFNNAFAARYLGGVPPSPDLVTIKQVHLSDATAEEFPFWSGSVISVKFAGTEATVALQGVMAKTSTQIPSQTFSWMCDHNLYDGRCRVVGRSSPSTSPSRR